MAKINADIKHTGLQQRDLIDLLYMIVSSIQGICAKLDADANVTDTDYESSCVTDLFNCVISDCRGNSINLAQDESSTLPPTFIIGPWGIGTKEMVELLYMIFNSWETLTEKMDADANPLTTTTYEADTYTAKFTKMVTNSKGNTLGNGNSYWFNPGGVLNNQHLVDILYSIVDAIETLCEQADTDAAPNDSDYESLWFTNNITLTVENSAGSRVGN